MGICLGMQLLFEDSSEHGLCEGLKLIKGKIRPLPVQKVKKYKIPNIGWYNLIQNTNYNNKLFLNLDEFYFIHSFYVTEIHDKNLIAYYNFGEEKYPLLLKKRI